jgi:protein-L-isoaspartate(D-aspartate) O-methyltransferase
MCRHDVNGKKCKRKPVGGLCWQHKSIGSKRPLWTTAQRENLFENLQDKISTKTLSAMKSLPRELFIPQGYRHLAYENRPIDIGEGQTISQPYIVGYMIDQLNVNPTDVVLDVGTGSGYNLAVLSRLAKKVVSIERIASLAKKSQKLMKKLNIKNVKIIIGDGTNGILGYVFDKIIVTAGGPSSIPQPLLHQLKIGGIMIIPKEGKSDKAMNLYKITKKSEKTYEEKTLVGVRFVPLIGKHGY